MNIGSYRLDINFLGCSADRNSFKMKLHDFLNEYVHKICSTCCVRKDHNILRIFDCKSSVCQDIYANAPCLTDFLCTECASEWDFLIYLLGELKIAYQINHRLVRGLDYYNKLCFEFSSDNLGAQTAFCGGGRYDDLIGQLSPKHAAPAVGAGIGIERLMLLVADAYENQRRKSFLIGLVCFEKEQVLYLLQLAASLTKSGIMIELLLDGSLKSNFKKADKAGCAYVVVVGPEEYKNGTVVVKNMNTGAQEIISGSDKVIIEYIEQKKRGDY